MFVVVQPISCIAMRSFTFKEKGLDARVQVQPTPCLKKNVLTSSCRVTPWGPSSLYPSAFIRVEAKKEGFA